MRALDSRGRFPRGRRPGSCQAAGRAGRLPLAAGCCTWTAPGTSLLLPGQALLIDFNSVWDTRRPDWGDFLLQLQAGLFRARGPAGRRGRTLPGDGYLSCGAVFFHLLSGRRLREGEAASGGFRRGLAGLPCLAGVPQSAASKAAEIPCARCTPCLAGAMRRAGHGRELGELLARLDGFGVSPSALWEAGRPVCGGSARRRANISTSCSRRRKGRRSRGLSWSGGLDGGGRFLLWPGGMGKSRLLLELAARRARSSGPGSRLHSPAPEGLSDLSRRGGLHKAQPTAAAALRAGGPGWEDAARAGGALRQPGSRRRRGSCCCWTG
ncbi:MAG: hypothetical protein ACLUEK_05420 [Oscillospiraceae bacterium]